MLERRYESFLPKMVSHGTEPNYCQISRDECYDDTRLPPPNLLTKASRTLRLCSMAAATSIPYMSHTNGPPISQLATPRPPKTRPSPHSSPVNQDPRSNSPRLAHSSAIVDIEGVLRAHGGDVRKALDALIAERNTLVGPLCFNLIVRSSSTDDALISSKPRILSCGSSLRNNGRNRLISLQTTTAFEANVNEPTPSLLRQASNLSARSWQTARAPSGWASELSPSPEPQYDELTLIERTWTNEPEAKPTLRHQVSDVKRFRARPL